MVFTVIYRNLGVSVSGLILGLTCFQQVSAIELSKMVADSISAHPQVKEKVHVYRQVLTDHSIASSGWKPSVDLEASTGLYNTESPSTGNTAVDYNSSRVELSITQNLFNGYDTTYQIEQTRSRSRAALYEIYDAADNIALDSIQAYIEVLKQRRLHVLATENVDSHEGTLSRIRERNESGVGRRSQLQQTEGRVARAHASLIAQQNNLRDSSTSLHQVLGRYVDPEALIEPTLPDLPPDDLNTLIDQALTHHPAMIVALNNIKASQSNHSRSKSNRYPNIDLQLASELGDDIDGITGNSEELRLVMNLTYNFYDGGSNRADQQKKISIVYEQKEFAARVRRQIINSLRLAWVADESLTKQLKYLDQHIVKAGETVESYREEFFIGQRDLVDLLDAKSELNTARNQYAEAYYDSIEARFRIFETMGQLFEKLGLHSRITEDNLEVARINARARDTLPLPTDEDHDRKKDRMDHCDNSLPKSIVSVYGCDRSGQVEVGYLLTNTAPILGNDEFEMHSNGILIISRKQLLANDTDNDKDLLEIVDIDKPGKGNLAFNQDKNLMYRPDEGFTGEDSFTYTVSDGKTGTATANVKITVIEADTVDLSKAHYVNFIYKSAELTEVSKINVISIIDIIRKAKNIEIEIKTYTDSIGSDAYNLALSKRRAKALVDLLIKEGLKGAMITAIGMGEKNPIADNSTKSGQAINRRGVFTFKTKDLQL